MPPANTATLRSQPVRSVVKRCFSPSRRSALNRDRLPVCFKLSHFTRPTRLNLAFVRKCLLKEGIEAQFVIHQARRTLSSWVQEGKGIFHVHAPLERPTP